MSYINDALRKARKVEKNDHDQIKKSIWSSLTSAVSAGGKKDDPRKKWYTVIGLSITFFYALGIIMVMYWPDIKPLLASASSSGTPVKVAAHPVVVPLVQSPSGQVQEMQAAPKTEALPDSPGPVAGEREAPKKPVVAVPAAAPKEESSKPEAESLPRKSEKKPSADPKKLYAQALEKQREGKLTQAKDLYRQVLKLQPSNVRALNNLGVVYMKMKRYKWAIRRFNQAIRIEHDYADAHYNLACLYAQMDNQPKSLFYLRNAVALNPEAKLWAAQDGDLKGLSDLAEYKNIIKVQDN